MCTSCGFKIYHSVPITVNDNTSDVSTNKIQCTIGHPRKVFSFMSSEYLGVFIG